MLESLGASFVFETVKKFSTVIPDVIAKRRVKSFFGKTVLGEKFYIVVDPFEHPEPRGSVLPQKNRYIKRFYGRKKKDSGLVGEDKVFGSCNLRTINYAVSFFGKFRNSLKPIRIVSDDAVLNIWDAGFLCFGSADSNVKTFDIEKLPENNFYSLSWDKNARCFNVGGKNHHIKNGEDVGVLVKIRNPRHNEHFLFLCEGLGEWGTSGAVYYLFHNFNNIYKRTKGKEFCMIIRTKGGSDESAREIDMLLK